MKAFLKDNYAFVIISGQLFLSTAFLYVTIENRFANIHAELTAINARLAGLEEGQRDIKKSLAELEETHRATIRLLERMDREYQTRQKIANSL